MGPPGLGQFPPSALKTIGSCLVPVLVPTQDGFRILNLRLATISL